MKAKKAKFEVLIDSVAGIYLPQEFVRLFNRYIVNHRDLLEDLEILRDPEHEWYWEAWDSVLFNAILKGDDGTLYYLTLSENGDLLAVEYDEQVED